MTRADIDALRLRYQAACNAYHQHANRVVESSKGGETPPVAELFAEEQALWELAKVRRELLDGLAAAYHAR
jgi:hypothetical protein